MKQGLAKKFKKLFCDPREVFGKGVYSQNWNMIYMGLL
jgi:hypothetical protein